MMDISNIGLLIWNNYVRTCLCSLLSMCAGLQLQVVLMKKKRSLKPLILFVLFKSLVDTFLLDGLLYDWIGHTRSGQILLAVFSLCLASGMAMLFVYTFKGMALENIIGIIISEFIITLIWLPCLIIVNYLGGRENLFTFYGRPQVWDLLLLPLAIFCPQFFCRLTGTVLRKYRTFQFPYRKVFWCAIFVYILGGQSTMFFGGQESNLLFAITMYILHLMVSAGIMGGIYVVYKRYQKRIQQDHEFLQMQIRLMETHYTALQQQIRKVEQGQRLVDQQMEQLTTMKAGSRYISSYLQELRSEYNQIQAGIYCDDWQVDAVLYCQIERAERQGISVDCSLQNYKRGLIPEEVIAQLFFHLLEYGIRENLVRKQRSKQQTGSDRMKLKAGVAKNILVIDFYTTCVNSRRFSEKIIAMQIQKYGEITELYKGRGEIRLVLIMRL